MENPNQLNPAEQVVWIGDTVHIPRSRYDELIRAEMEREVLFHAYQLMSAFSMGPVMDAIFNPKFRYKGETEANGKAGVGDAE